LLKTLAVELAHGVVLLAQERNAAVERVSDLKIITVELVLAIGSFIA
jgi:hypothetical protein